jgi:hypothetical protein
MFEAPPIAVCLDGVVHIHFSYLLAATRAEDSACSDLLLKLRHNARIFSDQEI